jgi:hypothetical protein
VDSRFGLPVVGNVPSDQCVYQYRRDEGGGQNPRGDIDCYSKAAEATGNQPPVERNERSFGEIQSDIEEVARDEHSLSSKCPLAVCSLGLVLHRTHLEV